MSQRMNRLHLLQFLVIFVLIIYCYINQQKVKLEEKLEEEKPVSTKFFTAKRQKCNAKKKPKESIFYIKIHKTGSTTLRSTLLIYARTYNLTVCMDSMNIWGLNWPYKIDDTRLTKQFGEKCDLIAEELIYDPKTVKRLMRDDVVVLLSVRDPIYHFLSLFKYSRIQDAVQRLIGQKIDQWESMRIFLKYPLLIQNVYATYKEDEVRDSLQANMVRPNLQLFSMGLNSTNKLDILTTLEKVHFIIVAEKYDESMVVLKEKLCCSLKDVLYRKQNVRRNGLETKESVPEDIRQAILEFNKGDMILYEMATKMLNIEIGNIDNFQQALQHYRNELHQYEKNCKNDEKFSCPASHNGQIGLFVQKIHQKQRENLLLKLRNEYKKISKKDA